MKKIEQEAKTLIEKHLKLINSADELQQVNFHVNIRALAKEHAIASANLCRDQFLLAPSTIYWNNVILAIKSYKFNNEQV